MRHYSEGNSLDSWKEPRPEVCRQKTDYRIVNVTRESQWAKRGYCCGEPATFITVDELYNVLAHGQPGEYILRGL